MNFIKERDIKKKKVYNKRINITVKHYNFFFFFLREKQ